MDQKPLFVFFWRNWGVFHCGYHRYLYYQGNEQTTGGIVLAAARPCVISNLPFPPYHSILHYIPVRCAPVLAVLAVMHIFCLLPDYCYRFAELQCICLDFTIVMLFCSKLSL